jgi:mercuric ion transport protein
MSNTPHNNKPLWLAGLAAIGASICCVGPLLLLTLGIGGTWISTLTAMEPVRPYLIALTLVILGWGFRSLYMVPETCEPEQSCADPVIKQRQRLIFWLVSVFLIALLTFPYYATLFISWE